MSSVKKDICVISCLLFMVSACTAERPFPKVESNFRYKVEPSCPEARDVLVGVNYFAGWWEKKPNKWMYPDKDASWLDAYPERTPLLGKYNTQETMDKEIVAASGYGVDFFMILWYPMTSEMKNDWYQNTNLNNGLQQFIHSPEAYRMKFMIECCNHPPFYIKNEEQWQKCIDAWMPAFKHPSYLKINNKLVFKVHACSVMYEDCGSDINRVKERLDVLRHRVRNEGLGEMIIALGAIGPMVWESHWVQNVCDFTCDYMDIPPQKPSHLKMPYPYDWLSYYLIQLRNGHRFDLVPYMPTIAAGWYPSPWGYPEQTRPPYNFPTRQEWKAELLRIAQDLHYHQNMGIPVGNKQLQKAFTIYAWNEFGEGGILAPTQGDGYMKLECIREVFGVKEFSENNSVVKTDCKRKCLSVTRN